MTVTVVDEVTPTSAAPQRGAGEQDYSDTADAWAASITVTTTSWNTSITQFNTAAVEINALAAATEANANAAIAAVNAVLWVSGSAYAIGDGVYSPTDLLSYRSKTVQANSVVDPNADQTNWKVISQQFQFQKGADIASATALVLGADGNYFDVTGAVTVETITTVGVGTLVKLHFDGILILTHNAADLVLPGGANITTQAGDEVEFFEYASGDWRCTGYTRADGTALVSSVGSASKVADGGISIGNPTALTTAGKVEVISGTVDGQTFGAGSVFESAEVTDLVSVEDYTTGVTVFFYRDGGNSNYLTGCIATVDPVTDTISYATPVVIASYASSRISASFDPDTTQIIVTHRNVATNPVCVVADATGTLSAGTPVVITGSYVAQKMDSCYDEGQNKGLVFMRNGSDGGGDLYVITVTGTVPSFGAVLDIGSIVDDVSICYSATDSKCIGFYETTGNINGQVFTISGTGVTGGGATSAAAVNVTGPECVNDVVSGTIVGIYANDSSSNESTVVVGTVSGTSISFGTPVALHATDNAAGGQLAYNSGIGQTIAIINNDTQAAIQSFVLSISGTVPTPSAASESTYDTTGTDNMGISYDSASNRIITSFADQGNSSFGTALVQTNEWATNANKFFGIAQATVLTTETVTNKTLGAVDTNQSLGAFAIGDKLWLNPADGSFSNTDTGFAKVGTVLSATDLFITQEAA